MRTATRLALSFLLVAALAAPALAETVTIPGSGSSQIILRNVAKAFTKANPGVTIDIPESSGTGGGYKAAGEGTAPLGRVSRPANEKEKGYNLSYVIAARLPVVIATHPGVKVKGLTWAQARDLVTGKITNWKDVGGQDLKVRVIARQPTEGNFGSIRATIPEWKDLVITEKSKMANTDQETVQFIAENEGGIGFITIADAVDKGLNILDMGGVKPSATAYPVFVDLALVHKAGLAGGAKQFLDFLFTPEAQGIMKANGAVPVSR